MRCLTNVICLLIAVAFHFSAFAADEDDCSKNHYILGAGPCGDLTDVTAGHSKTHRVGIGVDCDSNRICFWPEFLTINVGDSVTFFIYGDAGDRGEPRNVVADDGSFRCARGCDGEGGDGTPAGYVTQWHSTRTFGSVGVVRFHDEISQARGVLAVVAGPDRTVVEFQEPGVDNFFIVSDPAEQAFIDTGAHWIRTGNAFKAGGPGQTCRFSGNPRTDPKTGRPWGPSSHFFTADAGECASLIAGFRFDAPSWKFEGADFSITSVGPDGCPSDLVPVYRAYNNGLARGIDPNHRITSNVPAYLETIARGWTADGVVMCAPK